MEERLSTLQRDLSEDSEARKKVEKLRDFASNELFQPVTNSRERKERLDKAFQLVSDFNKKNLEVFNTAAQNEKNWSKTHLETIGAARDRELAPGERANNFSPAKCEHPPKYDPANIKEDLEQIKKMLGRAVM